MVEGQACQAQQEQLINQNNSLQQQEQESGAADYSNRALLGDQNEETSDALAWTV